MLGWVASLFVIFTAFFPNCCVYAASKEELEAKIERARRLVLDDPRASIEVGRELLTAIDAKQSPELWLQAALLTAGALKNTSMVQEFERITEQAIPLAKTLP